MPNIQVKLRRGTTAQHAGFTGAEGEVTVDTDKDTVIVHDGSTAGGHELAKASDAYTHPNHTGDVTSTGDGATVITDNAVTSAKISDTDTQFLVDDTSAQKTVVVNEGGADVDFRVEGDTDQNLLVCDAANDRVVIGADAPTESSKFAVVGNTTGQVVASIENAATTGSSVLVLKGPDPVIQCQDTTASTGKTFNIGVADNSIYIDLISGSPPTATRLFQLSDAGQLQLKSGTSPILFDL